MKPGKIDYKVKLKPLYTGKVGVIAPVTPKAASFLSYRGAGDPNSSADYQRAVEALFSVSYQLKFDTRKRQGVDYAVMPLEGLWWSDDMADFATANKANWKWTMMILQPPFITTEDVAEAKASVTKRRGTDLQRLEFGEFDEGACAQTLHVGPFVDEGPVIAALHAWIEAAGYELAGQHHEIYLTDIRRAAPARWKTIIRQPYEIPGRLKRPQR
jgi:hypothetical protein